MFYKRTDLILASHELWQVRNVELVAIILVLESLAHKLSVASLAMNGFVVPILLENFWPEKLS